MARWNVDTGKIRNAFILSTLSSLWLTFTNSSLFIIAAPTTYRCGRSNGFLLLNSLSNLFDKLTLINISIAGRPLTTAPSRCILPTVIGGEAPVGGAGPDKMAG